LRGYGEAIKRCLLFCPLPQVIEELSIDEDARVAVGDATFHRI
jgi:hypothetical protein